MSMLLHSLNVHVTLDNTETSLPIIDCKIGNKSLKMAWLKVHTEPRVLEVCIYVLCICF